jgi:predicted methyltransferase
MRGLFLGALSTMLFAGAASAQLGPRPPQDVAKDTLRHPREVLAFAGVKPGDTVIELIPGGGYYTRLLSAAVGPTGKVFAVIPTFLAERFPKAVDGEKALAAEPGYRNVTVVVEGLGRITDQGPADLVFTAENYHDLHNPAVPADTASAVDRAVAAALKPGGVFLVDDHVGAPGTGASQGGTLHRIEPALARGEIAAAGLAFDGESKVLANPADPHTAAVFDPSVRGRTDQFVFRFKKPG